MNFKIHNPNALENVKLSTGRMKITTWRDHVYIPPIVRTCGSVCVCVSVLYYIHVTTGMYTSPEKRS